MALFWMTELSSTPAAFVVNDRGIEEEVQPTRQHCYAQKE